jgi:anaerobic selenocysteine-containing dehydrogenase
MVSVSSTERVHFRTCSLCEAMCGIRIELDGDRITDIRGDDDDPFSAGHICPKAVALRDLHEDPDRLRFPMKREGTEWKRIDWEEAIELASRGLYEVQERHGRNAVATYAGNPTVHNLGAMLFLPMFLRAVRTQHGYSATSVDQLPHMLAAHLMFGHQLLLAIPDIDRTAYMLIVGANPLASNGSLMTAPGVRYRLRAIQERGGRLVVVDPRRTETAKMADEHLFVRPGSDALLLLAILHTIFEEKLEARRPARASAEGEDRVRAIATDFPPERAEPHTGIPASTIRRIAREFATAESAICYARVGASTQAFGTICQWLVNVLHFVTGNLDREGGAMFTKPALDAIKAPRGFGIGAGSFGRWKSRVRGLPEFGGELPVATLAEEILEEGEGRVRGLFTFAGNPVLSTPNGAQVDRALASLEIMVSCDIYLNETTRHANVILPPTGPLEHSHYDVAFHLLAVRNTAKYSPPLFEPAEGARHDWEILLALTEKLEALRKKTVLDGAVRSLRGSALRRIGPDGLIAAGLRLGPHRLSLRKLKNAPHGIDLGPLEPCLPERLFRARIDLAPDAIVKDVERLDRVFPASAAAVSNGELSLIGRRELRSNNSWMHNAKILVSGKDRCTLMIHPEDAKSRGIADGASVCVRSRVGSVTTSAQITDEVMRGVVSLPHGYGHDRAGIKLRVAREHAGASINDLTDDRAIDEASGNAAFSGVPVHVELAP